MNLQTVIRCYFVLVDSLRFSWRNRSLAGRGVSSPYAKRNGIAHVVSCTTLAWLTCSWLTCKYKNIVVIHHGRLRISRSYSVITLKHSEIHVKDLLGYCGNFFSAAFLNVSSFFSRVYLLDRSCEQLERFSFVCYFFDIASLFRSNWFRNLC